MSRDARGRKQKRKSSPPPSLGQRWRAWLASRQAKPVRREVLGGLLLILAACTILGLSRASSGSVLTWWASTVRRWLGWGAIPAVLAVGLLGLQLVWRELGEWRPLGARAWVGLEILLVVVLVAAHAPLVLREGVDPAFVAAEEGRAGGYVGWALAVPLMGSLGAAVGALVLVVACIAGLGLLLPLSWQELKAWGQHRGRAIAAAWSRWQSRLQGQPVIPEVRETPWWEQEAEPATSQGKPKRAGKSGKQRPPKPRSGDGSVPSLDLLDAVSPRSYGDTDVRRKVQIIEETLTSFGVPARVVEINQGPAVTQFGLDPGFIERRGADGQMQKQRVRVGRIASLVDDLALALAAAPLRIEAPVPGRPVVGLEVPNEKRTLVSLRGVMESAEYRGLHTPLAIALGEDVAGRPVAVDLATMPHLLIAGATGSGKSVCINAVVCCLLFNNTPADLQMLMIDPKMVELVGYNDIPHLVAPVVVDSEQVVGALAWVTRQMDERYRLLHEAGVRNLEQYNVRAARLKNVEPLPVLVVFLDELADLMMVAPDEIERYICRAAQMGRATGIHLVIATQRPSVDVVTGLIKANFPARISFTVTSQVDSRVILDQPGAENLLGRGDMLFVAPHLTSAVRLQGCFVSDAEIGRLTDHWRAQGTDVDTTAPWAQMNAGGEADGLLERAIEAIRGRDRVSTSFIQRQLRIGFPRAARLMDQLEEEGLVGPDEGAGRGRRVLSGQGIDFDEIDERLPGVEPR